MKKILIIGNSDIGLYLFRKELIVQLVKNGHDVLAIIPNKGYIKKLNDIGCKTKTISVDRRGINPIKDMKLYTQYKKIIKEYQPSVVLTYTIKPNVYGGIACRVNKCAYMATITGLGSAIHNEGIIKAIATILYKIGLKKANAVFAQNNSIFEFLKNHSIGSANIIKTQGSGVNLDENNFEEYPLETNEVKFLFVGRIKKEKGIEEYLECASRIKDKYENTAFGIIGNYDEEIYKDKIIDLSEKGIIDYYGEQDGIHSFLKECHAFILPTYHEGMSNVLQEAAATGRPVITSRIPGCKEIFDERISGIGFEKENADSLYDAIEKFIKLSYEEKKQMGINGRRKVEKEFDRNIVVKSYINEINKVISK